MKILIIGNGVAGISTAETIRASDKNSEITIVSKEPQGFYSRPRLIDFLAGKVTVDQITIHDAAWYAKNDIEFVGSVDIAQINDAAKRARDENGTEYSYDKLVVASGGFCFKPPVHGNDAANIFTLRTIDDAEKIKHAAHERKRAILIGGGLLGIEAANSLLSLGVEVRVIEIFDRLLPRQLDAEGSVLIQRLLERKGLSFSTGKQTQSIDENGGDLTVRLKDGSSFTADFILFSAGARPNLRCIQHSPINRNNGVIVDSFMRTNVPDVYACGDVAECDGVLYGLWQPAREQGITCGNHIVGKEVPFKKNVPSTRLKVAGIEFASIGEIEIRDGIKPVVEKDETAGVYKKVFFRRNKPVGAILIGNVKEAVKLQQEIRGGGAVER